MNYNTLFDFESALAEYTGAPYAVATIGCTQAIELAFRYDRVTSCEFTAFTYLSIPQLMKELGVVYQLKTDYWTTLGEYQFYNTRIWDSARLLKQGMYRSGQVQCLSFGNGKPLQLGRVGAILTDDVGLYEHASCMRSDGRDLRINPWIEQESFGEGYHYCPMLEDCRRGIEQLPLITPGVSPSQYPDLRKLTFKH